jgi:two-component system response regulator RegX3
VSRPRVAWLVLADREAATDEASVRVIADPRRFRDILLAERPRVVVLAQPPAGTADLELVAQERRRRAGMRAVHLAAPEAVELRLAALGLGFDDALSTETPAVELVGRLVLLESRLRAQTRPGPILALGEGLELDLVAHELRRDGAVVHLRPKELRLLALLGAHPGRAYTRRQLLDQVWGPGHDDATRTVDVHVRWLRSKIERDPGHPARLITIRGVGYRLDPPQR